MTLHWIGFTVYFLNRNNENVNNIIIVNGLMSSDAQNNLIISFFNVKTSTIQDGLIISYIDVKTSTYNQLYWCQDITNTRQFNNSKTSQSTHLYF